MLKRMIIITTILLAFILSGCSGSASVGKEEISKIPVWFEKLPEDPNFIFGAGEGKSRELQIATDNAAAAARADVGRTIELKLSDMAKRFAEQTGEAENAQILQMTTQVTKTVVSTVLTGCKIAEKKIHDSNGLYQVFALAQYPIGAANQAFTNQIKSKEELYTRFRASQAFQEMEDDVKKYEEWKAKQGN